VAGRNTKLWKNHLYDLNNLISLHESSLYKNDVLVNIEHCIILGFVQFHKTEVWRTHNFLP
jgi:hypothetical protein